MKITRNFILGAITSCVLLFLIFWMVQIQSDQNTLSIYKEKKEDVIPISLKLSIERGKKLFIEEDCYSCHKPDKKDGFFRVVIDRVSKEWLYKFIRDEKSLIEDKDSVVLYLRQRFNQSNGKHDKKHLTNDQLNDILNYLNSF
ncbi:c-type cytochrome [Tenacibaculum jejuense]|uniref:Putative cytochrome c n=1 Tax=Tenacibaculum jejuense TaxID=584609 RepID=A0A238U5Z8_9FLAO|nr:cytochrome c [Tenacibaculum jejuense]SNR14629.1 putative cytochrome c [Tenacibaculum jejuense]